MASVNEGKKPFKCDICNAQFTSKNGMKGHIATIHEGINLNKMTLLKNMLQQFMKEGNNLNVTFVMLCLHQNIA